MKVRIKKIHEKAILPHYDYTGDAGLNLYAIEYKTLTPGERYLFGTGIAFEIPEGYVGLVWERSGLSNKHGLIVLGGVIDSGYRGEIRVGLFNSSKKFYIVKAGDKIAQMLIQQVVSVDVEEVDELSDTGRGKGGFGSTGY